MSRKFDVRRAGSGAVLAGCWMLLSGGADPVAAVSKSLTFDPLTASVMQGSLDAGPNLHVLYPEDIISDVRGFIEEELKPLCENGTYLEDWAGEGPVQE